MNGWGWAFLAFLVLQIALACSTVTMQLHYSRLKDNDRFYIFVKAAYGLVKYRYEVPLIKFRGLAQGILVKKEHVNETGDRLMGEKSETVDKDKIITYFRKVREILKGTFDMREWIMDSMAKVTCTRFVWSTRVGLGDAAETAILTGVIWTLKSSAVTYLFRRVKRGTKPRLAVVPEYAKAHFSTEVSCIGKIRLGHAMLAGLHLVFRILKVKGGIKRWQSILFKAS